MSPFTRWVPTLMVLLTIPGRHAAAQFNVIGPGSTIAGDGMRGEGAAAAGWGMAAQGWGMGYHLAALGRAADADTLLRIQDAANQALESDSLKRHARAAAR